MDNKVTTISIDVSKNKTVMPYQKSDIVKTCFFNGTFALSFYQLDYQKLADFGSNNPNKKPENVEVIAISKICMDLDGFKRFMDELNLLYKNVEKNIKLINPDFDI